MVLDIREMRKEGSEKWDVRSERKEKREKRKEIWILTLKKEKRGK